MIGIRISYSTWWLRILPTMVTSSAKVRDRHAYNKHPQPAGHHLLLARFRREQDCGTAVRLNDLASKCYINAASGFHPRTSTFTSKSFRPGHPGLLFFDHRTTGLILLLKAMPIITPRSRIFA